MSAENVNNYKQITFCDIFGQLHTQQYKVTKKKVVRFQLNEKKSKEIKGKQDNINELIQKAKSDLTDSFEIRERSGT